VPGYRQSKSRYRKITVHPPEAEAAARAFGESRSSVERDAAELDSICASLESGWKGDQKTRFMDEFRPALDRIRNLLLPHLRNLEKRYREYTVEETVEDTAPD
jgi:uncharacterized protein YukE